MKPYKKALLGGTFSLLHAGHIDILRQANMLADKVVVALNSDEFVERFKGKKPVDSYEQREEILKCIDLVHEIVKNEADENFKVVVEKVKPDLLVQGSDWLDGGILKQWSIEKEWLEKKGIPVIFFSRHIPISTTIIKERVKNG